MTRVLVTGGAGFIGSHALVALDAAGCATWGGVRSPASAPRFPWPAATERVVCDLDDGASVAAALARVKPDVVVHLAWGGVAGRGRHDPRLQLRNLYGWLDLLGAASAAGARRVIGVGSQAEYGVHGARIDEQTLCRPSSQYGVAKLAAWHAGRLLAAEQGLELAWLRLFSTFGPGDHETYVLPFAITSLLRGASPELTGGEQRWDFVYVEDLAARLARVAVDAAPVDGVYNLATGRPPMLRTLIELAHARTGGPGEPLLGALPYRGDGQMRLEGDPTAFEARFGAGPDTPIEEAIARTVDWFRDRLAGGGAASP